MDGKMQFIYQFAEHSPRTEVTLSPESTLTEVVEQFEIFLKAAGYGFDGALDFVQEESNNGEI